ncbi:MAG: hypothetical protein EOO47_01615 [Flavobacterium sp.]|nr:MAG: hypothetical protein EOO47_01615 [Flavobacterium sp.]
MKKSILIIALTLIAKIVFAQAKNPYLKLAGEIKKNTDIISGYNYSETPDLNIDSICLVTAKKSVKLLTNNNWSESALKKIGLHLSLDSKDANAIRVFNFGYDCGGTRRVITHPIIQWKNKAGKTFAYNFSSKINCRFNEVYKLKSSNRDLYLLVGQESGDGSCYQSVAYVIEIKGDFLILDQPFFADLPFINLCNLEYDFNPKTQEFRGLLEHASSRRDLTSLMPGVKTEKLKALIAEGYFSEPSQFELKFDGQKFVKVKNEN